MRQKRPQPKLQTKIFGFSKILLKTSCMLYGVIFAFLSKSCEKLEVDVMITIFCDFRQFLAKNWHFLKNQCCDQFFNNLA
jgi:hypothetical protein